MKQTKRLLALALVLILALSCAACAKKEPEKPQKLITEQRDYSTAPDILTMNDGTKVTTAEQMQARRLEMLALLEENLYGYFPKTGDYTASYELVKESDTHGGDAVLKQVKVTVTTGKGSQDAMFFFVLPKSDKPVPVLLRAGSSNMASYADEAVLPSVTDEGAVERSNSDWPVDDLLSKGIGFGGFSCSDFAPDTEDAYATTMISLFDEPEFKALSAWAFGLQLAADYAVTDSSIQKDGVCVTGHSRTAKAAVWAAAQCENISFVYSNDSGCGGVDMIRSPGYGKQDFVFLAPDSPRWFGSNIQKYAGSADDFKNLAIDQHMLVASVAPRKVAISAGKNDIYSDYQGALATLQLAKVAYQVYGCDVLEDMTKVPKLGEMVSTSSMAYWVINEGHFNSESDWNFCMQYITEQVKK